MAFDRFKTKVAQTVGNAEKTVTSPELKEGLKQFEDSKKISDDTRDLIKEAMPIAGKWTKIEMVGTKLKEIAAKYGLDKSEGQGIQAAGDIFMGIGKEERALLAKVEQETYAMLKSVHDYYESLNKERKKMETAATDMDGANLDWKKSGKDPARAQSATRAYGTQKAAVEGMVATLSEQRDKQRQAFKNLIQSYRDFCLHSAEIIEQNFANLG